MDAPYPSNRQPSMLTPYHQLTPEQQRQREQFLKDLFAFAATGAAIIGGGFLVVKAIKAL